MDRVMEDFQQFAVCGGPATAMPGDLLAWLDRDPRSGQVMPLLRGVERNAKPAGRTSRG